MADSVKLTLRQIASEEPFPTIKDKNEDNSGTCTYEEFLEMTGGDFFADKDEEEYEGDLYECYKDWGCN